MNQREYSWTEKELNLFIDDIVKIFEEGKYVERMGSIIIYKGSGYNEIYDGQQRTISSILILIAIAELSQELSNSNKFYNHILNKISITEFDKLTDLQNKIKTKEKFSSIKDLIIPKIYCINPNDMDALVEIFNKQIKIYLQNCKNNQDLIDKIQTDNNDNNIENDIENDIDNKNNIDIENDNDIENIENENNIDIENECKIECNKCNTVVINYKKFIKHIKTEHKLTSKIYNAYLYIYEKIVSINYNYEKLRDLYDFIINDTNIQIYECTDSVYVSKIFEWENNRGLTVEKLDVIKNSILTKLQDDKKFEIYEKWEELKNLENKIYKKEYGNKLFDIAIQIYNREFSRKLDYTNLYNKITNNPDVDVLKKVTNLFTIIKNLNDIYKKIEANKYGKLLTTNTRISLPWEAYMWCFLPIFHEKNAIDEKIIKLFVQWYFRNIGFKNKTFNYLGYSTEFINITNAYLKDKKYNYLKYLQECLQKNIDISVNSDNYQNNMIQRDFKNTLTTSATFLLMFLETCENTDKNIVNLQNTLEHIIPQKNRGELKDLRNIDKIGNLTLLEGGNSENGHKGNSSLGAKEYDKKKTSYSESSIKITREIPKDFPEQFTENDITKRTNQIVKLLDKHTKY
jgi:hypothetical protein